MSLPGAGLLAVLRGQAQGTPLGTAHDPPRPATTAASPAAPAPEDRRFSARSDAVRAVEHAVAAGGMPEVHKRAARGRLVPPGDEYVFDMDVHAPHEAQVELEVCTPVLTFVGWVPGALEGQAVLQSLLERRWQGVGSALLV